MCFFCATLSSVRTVQLVNFRFASHPMSAYPSALPALSLAVNFTFKLGGMFPRLLQFFSFCQKGFFVVGDHFFEIFNRLWKGLK